MPDYVTYNNKEYRVTIIGENAFHNNQDLTSIILPDDVTSIEKYAFKGCKSLTSVTLPEGLEYIRPNAFQSCKSLTSINLPESLTSIAMWAFDGCSSLTSITLPESLTTLTQQAFQNCTSLTSITIPKKVTTISQEVFYGCTGLTSITISEGVKTIEERAFKGCSSLTSITIPKSVTSIKTYAFEGCGANEIILNCNIPGGVVSTGLGPFSNSSFSKYIINETVTEIGSYAFIGCTGEIVINSNQLSSYGLGTTTNKFSKITFGENVISIPDRACLRCTSLTTVIIPESVTSIGAAAFYDCTNLTDLYCYAKTPPSTGEETFDESTFQNVKLHVPTKYQKLYQAVTPWSKFSNFAIDVTAITLSQSEATIAEGETLTLTATVAPENATDKSVKWSCSDKTVAYVDSKGQIRALNPGTATITATARDAGAVSASCEVTVVPASYVITYIVDDEVYATDTIARDTPIMAIMPQKEGYTFSGWVNLPEIMPANDITVIGIFIINEYPSLTLDATKVSLTPNETLTLTATLLPEGITNSMLAWNSSNETVATVDEYGLVTAVADGEATITVSTTDGSNLSATCVVTVETKEAEGDVMDYDNIIYFEDATAFVNTTLTLPLQMRNSASITAVQFDMYLPKGVTIGKNSRGKYNITFNEDRADNTTHTLSSALQNNGAIRVLCYSTESYDFLGNEGDIFYFPLEIPEMEDGDYDIVINGIVLTNVSGKKYELPSMTSTITVFNVAPGDCNADNSIDVADIVVLANHILGNTADGFVEKAADYNADGAVDVADIVNIANYILNGNTSAAHALTREVLLSRAASAGYSFDILPFVLATEGSKTISLDLADPTESFTAFQCDLYLPEGISIDTNNRGKYKFSFNEERTDASFHTLSGSLQTDGSVRILCYSTDSEVFFGTDGALINIPLTADASLKSGVYEFSIANTVLTYVDGRKVEPELYRGSIIVGDGGEIESMKLYGKYTVGVLKKFTSALSANESVTSVDLTDGVSVAESGMLTTGNPNTLIYLAENAALANANNVVCGEDCSNLKLTDGYAFAAQTEFVALQASYTRELAAGKYGTITLPFAPENEYYIFYELTSVGNNTLTFDEVDEPQANTPYLYSLRDGKSATAIIGTGAMVSSELITVETEGWQTVGSFAYQTLQTNDEGYYAYAATDNQFHRVTKTLSVKPFRAYLKGDMDGGVVLKVRTRNGNETLIDASEVEDMLPKVYYDLSGRRVEYPTKGVYVVNGKKVVL